MKPIRQSVIIHSFALLHALVTILCSLGGIPDTLLLTFLTMALTVIICLRRNLSVEFTAISVILFNIGGLIMGTLGADFFGLFLRNDILMHALSTFTTTEILGWVLDLTARRINPDSTRPVRQQWNESMGWLVFAVVTVFGLRVVINLTSGSLFEGESMVSLLGEFLSNALVLILLIGITVAIVFLFRSAKWNRWLLSAAAAGFFLAVALAAAWMVGHGLPFHFHKELSSRDFIRLFIIALLAEVTIFAIVYMIFYLVRAQNEVLKEREKTHQAEFRYMTLKQQVNPHFLFNSLNILDSLVMDGEKEDASRYIHKLAGIYRYMLQHEGENLVRISEELYFAEMYYGLLKVRFPEGLLIETDVPDEDRSRYIIPCTLQLLIENATKHNAISSDNPLRIRIFSDGKNLCVENNLVPKTSPVASTGLGIKYITRQYRDSAREVRIEKAAGKYTVHLPLL